MSVDSEMNVMGHAQADNPDWLAVLFSLDNSHNGVDLAKATVLGCEILCLKRGNFFLLTVHASPTQ